MASDKPPYTFVIRKRRTEHWYFRFRTNDLKPLPGRPGDPAFHRRYADLIEEAKKLKVAADESADSNSLRWLAEQYEASDQWQQLSGKTRKDYARELERLKAMAGDLPFSKLTAKGVREMRKRVKADTVAAQERRIVERGLRDAEAKRAGKPISRRNPPAPVTPTTGARTADYFKSVLSALLAWAVEEDLLDDNPAIGIIRLHRKRNVESRVPWTETQIETVLGSAPRWIVDGVIVGLYTGQRLGDCMIMGKGHCVLPEVRVRPHKVGGLMIDIPAVGPLRDLIDRRLAAGDDVDALVLRDDGQPYSERLFSEHLRNYLDGLGWTDISFHGLRYASAGTLNEAGCTVATIVSIMGHSTYEMALQYLAGRENRARAAKAMEEASANRVSRVANSSK